MFDKVTKKSSWEGLKCTKCIFSQYTFFMYKTAANQYQLTNFNVSIFIFFLAIKRVISKKKIVSQTGVQ